MPKLTPQEATKKQADRLKSSTPLIQAGVQRVTEAPGIRAAKKADKMLQGITEAVQSGKWQQRVAAVTLQEWQDKMINLGISRIASGIDKAAPKMTAFYEQLFPYQEQAQREIAAMPDLTLEDNLNRMTTYIRRMAQFSYRR